MDIVEIKSFLAVIECRSFTLAAKRVHITQSAMSKRIQKIENELGVRLFIIEGSKITLTEAANHFVPYARQMLASYNNALKSFKDKEHVLRQHLVIGASVFVSHYVLPAFLNYLKMTNSYIQIHIRAMGELDIEEYLNRGIVDLVICPDHELTSKVVKTKLWQEKYYLVASKEHEFFQLKNPSLKDLEKYPAVLTDRGGMIRDNLEAFFREHQLNLNLGLEISTLEAIKTLVEYGLGWSILPKVLISERLKLIDIDMNIPIDFTAYYLKKRMDDRGISNLLYLFDKWQHPNPEEEKILW